MPQLTPPAAPVGAATLPPATDKRERDAPLGCAPPPEVAPAREAGSCLDSSGKTVTGGQRATNPRRWQEDLEHAYHRRLAKRERIRYRLAALGRRDERVESCAKRRCWVSCGCGSRQVGGCGVRALCAHCLATWRARLRQRALKSLAARYASAPARWFTLPSGRRVKRRDRFRFLTLTVRHSGDLEHDRARLQRGWVRFRAWWRKAHGHASDYIGMWEISPGSDGRGHIHLHLVVLWPWWVDYGPVCEAWRRAVDDEQAAPDIKTLRSMAGAVWYVLHYSSKGLSLDGMSGTVAGDVMATTYARRTVTTSRGFWLPRPICCQTCGQWWQVERCAPLRKSHPALWWRAVVWATRGPPTVPLALVARDGAPMCAK